MNLFFPVEVLVNKYSKKFNTLSLSYRFVHYFNIKFFFHQLLLPRFKNYKIRGLSFMLIVNLFAINQLGTLSISVFMILDNIVIFLPARMNLKRSENFAMSFM